MRAEPLHVALVGCGAIAELGHAPALLELAGECTVTSVVDPVRERRDLLGSMLGVPEEGRRPHVAELLSEGFAIDLAVLVLPPEATGDAAARLLRAGVRVLSEKPFAEGPAAATAIGRDIPRAQLGVVHNYGYRSDVRQARNLLARGAVGRPRFLRLERPDPGHFPGRGADPHWRRRGGTTAGALLDNAYHWIYLAQELAGAPVTEVTARLAGAAPGESNDLALVLLAHGNGVLTSIQSAWCATRAEPVLEIHGHAGSLSLTGDCGTCVLTPATGAAGETGTDGKGFVAAVEPAYTAMYRDVFACVRAGLPFGAPLDACVDVLEIIAAAAASAAQGRTVRIGAAGSPPGGGNDGGSGTAPHEVGHSVGPEAR